MSLGGTLWLVKGGYLAPTPKEQIKRIEKRLDVNGIRRSINFSKKMNYGDAMGWNDIYKNYLTLKEEYSLCDTWEDYYANKKDS